MSSFWRNINGKTDPHTYQTTVIGQEITNDSNISLYLGIAGYQASPAVYSKGDYAVFSMMGNIETDHKTYLYIYKYSTAQVSIAYDWGSYAFGDYHSHALPIILNDGRILMIVESNHNNQFEVKRSLNPYDITEYETIAVVDDLVAYNNLTLIGDRIYITCRSFPLIENAVRYSDDNGETWSELVPILNTGAYANYWAYPKTVFSKTKLMHFVNISDHVLNDGYSTVYYLESVDGINYSNKAGTYTRNVTDTKLSAQDLEDYYKVRDITPHFQPTTASCSDANGNAYYVLESPTTDGGMEFGYWNGSAWATKLITVSGIFLRDANRTELLSTGIDSFVFYCCEYETFASPITATPSRIVKITTDDAFDTWSHEFLTDASALNYSVAASHNFNEFSKTPIIALVPKVYGSGSDVDPLNSYANFKIVDVI